MTTNFNLRGIDSTVMTMLKKKAAEHETSVNLLILKIIERSLGYSHEISRPTYHDLDNLAGTWSAKEAKEFEKKTKYFSEIDKDMWS